METAVDYHLSGIANNTPVAFSWPGSADADRGKLSLAPIGEPRAAYHWDAALAWPGALDILVAELVLPAGPDDAPTLATTWTVVHDDQVREVGRVEQSIVLERNEEGGLVGRAQLLRGESSLELLERIARFEDQLRPVRVPSSAVDLVVASTCMLGSNRGGRYRCISISCLTREAVPDGWTPPVLDARIDPASGALTVEYSSP